MLDVKTIRLILLGPPVIIIIGLIGFYSNKETDLNNKKTYFVQNEENKECKTIEKI